MGIDHYHPCIGGWYKPRRPASSLDLKDAINIFELKYNQLFDAWALADNEVCTVPALLGTIFCVDWLILIFYSRYKK